MAFASAGAMHKAWGSTTFALSAQPVARSPLLPLSAAAAACLPFIAIHPMAAFTVHADAASTGEGPSSSSRSPSSPSHVTQHQQQHSRHSRHVLTASPADWRAELRSLLSTFHPWSLATVVLKHMGLQVLMRLNQYMLQLLDHEARALEAEEQGQPAPEPPPIPDFKPCFTAGMFQSAREVAQMLVRKVYEIVAVRRLGYARAEPFLRDYRVWIRDVLAFKFRESPLKTRFYKYLFATLHGALLWYAADCTVNVAMLIYTSTKLPGKTRAERALFVARGSVGQAIICTSRFAAAALGASLFSLVQPGRFTTIGSLAFDLAAGTAVAPIVGMYFIRV